MIRVHFLFALLSHFNLVTSDIYLPTTTIDTTTQKLTNVVDVFKTVSYNSITTGDQQQGQDNQEEKDNDDQQPQPQQEYFDERYFNRHLTSLHNHSNKVPCLYLVAFSQRPTAMERQALTMLMGSESNIVKLLQDHAFLVWSRRATAAAASVAINHLVWSGKFIGQYKYSASLLQAVALAAKEDSHARAADTGGGETAPSSFQVLVTVVPFVDVSGFTTSLMSLVGGEDDSTTSALASATSLSISLYRKYVVKVEFLSKTFKMNWEWIKKIAKYCEVVQIDAADSLAQVEEKEVSREEHRPGRSKLLRSGM
jgi:hypothetical protein